MEVLKWLVYSVLTVYAALPTWNLHRNLLLNWGALLRLTSGRETRNPKIIIGRDTRLSGTMLEAALAAGICSAGGNAHLFGV